MFFNPKWLPFWAVSPGQICSNLPQGSYLNDIWTSIVAIGSEKSDSGTPGPGRGCEDRSRLGKHPAAPSIFSSFQMWTGQIFSHEKCASLVYNFSSVGFPSNRPTGLNEFSRGHQRQDPGREVDGTQWMVGLESRLKARRDWRASEGGPVLD